MTNKELASRLAKTGQGIPVADLVLIDEAARRLRELPDPTPEPLTLRGLVEKHRCLSAELSWRHESPQSKSPWKWQLSEGDWNCITDAKALTVVRGIVRGLCHELGGAWHPVDRDAPDGKWFHYWEGEHHYHATELEAIDALLTAMQVCKG
jgi:hypothetical protein